MQFRAIGIIGHRVLFSRCGRVSVGEPSRVSRYYSYNSAAEAWRAFSTDRVGKGQPEANWRNVCRTGAY